MTMTNSFHCRATIATVGGGMRRQQWSRKQACEVIFTSCWKRNSIINALDQQEKGVWCFSITNSHTGDHSKGFSHACPYIFTRELDSQAIATAVNEGVQGRDIRHLPSRTSIAEEYSKWPHRRRRRRRLDKRCFLPPALARICYCSMSDRSYC